jgi:beta-glucosidase
MLLRRPIPHGAIGRRLSEVDERTLREIYLPPFKAAVQEAGSWAVMSAYNKLNGVYCSENPDLLGRILKDEWGFEGIVMSDWSGTYSTAGSANAGLDLEMPGPTKWRGEKLLRAVQDGQVCEDTVTNAARRLLRTIIRCGALDEQVDLSENSIDKPEHQAIARQAAAESIVLLKNDGDILPLDSNTPNKIAIIGPNAKTAQIMGGGSARVNPHYAVAPYDGVVARVGEVAQIGYEIGCSNYKQLPLLDMDQVEGQRFTVLFYNSPDLSGERVFQSSSKLPEQIYSHSLGHGVDSGTYSVRLTAHFRPLESGTHRFGLVSAGLSRFYVDGREVIDNWMRPIRGSSYYGWGTIEETAEVEMRAGKSYELCLEYSNESTEVMTAVRLGHLPPTSSPSIEKAISLAADSDVALLFVGSSGEWEHEGQDRPDMKINGQQAALIEGVAAANPNTVVILQTGSPISMPWLDQVSGLVQAWFPGQECGNAIADVLFGDVNPSGKLPQTFPVRLEDNPTYVNYPGENGQVRYGEGLFVGYRYYDKKKITPLFPFGYGLSYTRFAYDNLRLSAGKITVGDELTINVDVTNIGDRSGKETIQLYIKDIASRLIRPDKELKSFAKLALEPGETQTVTLTLDESALTYWDDSRGEWVAEPGEFEVLVGSSSRDIQAQMTFTLAESG